MLSRLYDNLWAHYNYLVKEMEDYEELDNGELLIHLKNGDKALYNPFEDWCRRLPKDSRSMTENECTAEFAARLRNVMRRKGYSQQQLSVRTGISQPAISNYVTGRRMPSFYMIDKIAKALNCSVDELRYL